MAAQDAEEFDFSDDDFDALPENDLLELENTAIRLTQKPPSSLAQGRASVAQRPRHHIDNYGFEDEDVIDLNQQTVTFPGPSNGSSTGRNHRRAQHGFMNSGTRSAGPAHDERNTSVGDLAELRLRIAELERERDNLKNTVQSHKGEIAIVRSKHDQSTREYERKISVMQQLHTETVVKQKAEVEKAQKERETVETNSRFLEHDLAQEMGRSKATRRTLKDGTGNKSKISVGGMLQGTPKKDKACSFGDGFDDEDIVMLSPSKPRERSKPSTPKVGGKRKRPVVEQQSPSLPLVMSESRNTLKPNESIDSNVSFESEQLTSVVREDHRFQFLQRLMAFQPSSDQERLFDALSKMTLPSTPTESLSTSIFEKLSSISPDTDPATFPDTCFRILMDTWSHCLRERHFPPINCFMQAIQFMLAFEPQETLAHLIPDLVPLALATIDVVAIPLGRASVPEIFPQHAHSAVTMASTETGIVVDVWTCLSLLHETAISCALTSERSLRDFWQLMQHDFILLMLMKAQPISQICIALRLVANSALESSFGAGPQTDTQEQKARRETLLLDRLTYLLFDLPDQERKTGPLMELELANLRVEVLTTISAIALTTHGAESLARHRQAIGRLIRFLCDAVDTLYDFFESSHTETVQAINICVRLLHRLIKDHPSIVDVKMKLDAVQGGTHKHLVSLTRLAFSDTLVLEGGVDEEVTDMAHQLLDDFLSPEEGEALCQVFSSAKSLA